MYDHAPILTNVYEHIHATCEPAVSFRRRGAPARCPTLDFIRWPSRLLRMAQNDRNIKLAGHKIRRSFRSWGTGSYCQSLSCPCTPDKLVHVCIVTLPQKLRRMT